jgi:amino acid adenylation domain-containing protein
MNTDTLTPQGNSSGQLPELLGNLSADRRALLALRLSKKTKTTQKQESIPRRPATEYSPLSFAQRRLWFLDQLEPGLPIYNIPMPMRVNGALKIPALERALSEIVRRHEVLRTSFSSIDGEPIQIVAPFQPLTLTPIDLSTLPETERESAARQLVTAEVRKPFDLGQAPLMRVNLLRLSEQEHVVLFTVHHVIFDGWSTGVLVNEVSNLYEAFAHGRRSPLPELPIQYADFAHWQQQWLASEAAQEGFDYWRNKLAGAAPFLNIPTDRSYPLTRDFIGGGEGIRLTAIPADALRVLSRQEGGTLFIVLLAAFQTLLYRYTGQTDIVVGTPIAGRNRIELEGLVGFFANTLALRTQLSGDLTFRELFSRVRETALTAYGHQDVPFEKLVEELQPERSVNRTPLFQVLFALQNEPSGELESPGLKLSTQDFDYSSIRFDLECNLWEHGHDIRGLLSYAADVFDAATAYRMCRHFETLLTGVAANPDQRLFELPLLSEEEQQRLLVEWNDTQAEYGIHQPIHRLFEEQVARTPEQTALVFEEQEVTYEQLNERANQLAHHLRELGVGPEVSVAVMLDRSVELIVTLLAVLKAGGAYLPLDPAYPVERLRFMLQDSGASILLTEQQHAELVSAKQVVCVDTVFIPQSAANLGDTPDAEHAAYVIYTSGSTGEPKGVVVPHRAISNHLLWRQEQYPLSAQDRFLQKASVSFDISVWEIFGTLVSGARLIMARPGGHQDPAYLVDLMASQEVTTAHFGPALLQAIVDEPAFTNCKALRHVFTGGEELCSTLQEQFFSRSSADLHHQYGPTETTVDVTVWDCVRSGEVQKIPIGTPIGNTRVYVLDSNGGLVPTGVPGELHVGGESLARGYLRRPELTTQKFVPDAFSGEAGARLYRTGDLVKWNGQGELEYLGRVDQQVKLRGYRIELGEIEARLLEHEAVTAAVVLMREDNGDKRLVGYVVSASETAPSSRELRSYLSERLPEYMVPAAIVLLDELPLTANGKVNRRALPAPDATAMQSCTVFTPARTPVEEVLVGIWAEVLKVAQVSVHDNFFDLGGHSLLATRLMSRVRNAFQIEIPLRSLFESPTVAQFAERVEDAVRQGQGVDAPPMVPVDRSGELPLSFAQQRLWFLDQLEPGNAFYNIPTGVRLSGQLQVSALEAALSEVVRRHEALRTTFTMVDGDPCQVVGPPYPVTLAMTDLSGWAEAEREAEARRLSNAEGQQSFDLAQGPLLRARLLKLADEEHIVLLTMHHIVSDGWSMGLLIEELSKLYVAYVSGAESPLAELPIQYGDFAHWQQHWLQGEVLEQQMAYWRAQLADAPAVLELPADRPRPAVQSFRGTTHSLAMSAELTESLKRLSRGEGVTLFMTLLAAFQTLLSRYTGQRGISVGTPIANRNRRETEPLIGFFVNTLVLHTEVRGAESFRQLLKRVREQTLGAYAHQDVPFEKLVEELQPERNLSTTPLFQVMFVYQNAESGGDGVLALPGLRLSGLESENHTAKFELTLAISEGKGGLGAGFEYNTDLFNAETIERLAQHFERLLESIVADPEQSVAELEFLSAAEREQLLIEWNDTHVDYPAHETIPQLFEAQVARTPEQTALVCGESSLTYAELNQRANQLAHYLRELGVGPEVRVGVLLERSVEMVVSLLGILKAGGAYVPLDPQYPQSRLAFMLEDARAELVLSQQSLCELASAFAHSRLVYLDAEQAVIGSYEVSNPAVVSDSQNLAYLIYTSGSTGTPKGVAIEHHSTTTLIHWAQQTFTTSALGGVLASTSLCFDLSIFELFVPLSSGGQVIVADNALALTELAARDRVTLINTVPSAMAELVRLEALPQSVAVVNLAGEALSRLLVESVYEELPHCAVYNLYGPSEDTTYSTALRVPQGETKAPLIGRPLANTQGYVLDQAMQLVPAGVAGELYLSGAGLARGYLGRADLSAERFVPNPWSTVRGERMYRTGDLVRWTASGELEYLGRLDQQVKVRGYRIELGEIEARLLEQEAVEAAVVVVREDEGDKRLVAYVVAAGDAVLNTAELRTHLGSKLPEYMIPAAFVMLDELPLTANGKVNRRALPTPDAAFVQPGTIFVAARTPVEEVLVGIWAEVLKLAQVGIHDNFFDLGGHSLLATRLISRVRHAFQIEIPLRSLFESPTVAQFAERVEDAVRRGQGVDAPPMVPVDRSGELPLSFAQQRLWFLDQLEPGNAFYNIPTGVRLSGQLQVSALEAALTEVVRRHEALRTTFTMVDGDPCQLIGPPYPMTLAVTDLSGWAETEREDEARRLANAEGQQSFDLAQGPLLRARLLKLADEEHIVLLTMHHIVSDGWSMGLLIDELSKLYVAFVSGSESPLPELPIQYGDFAHWQQHWLQGEVLEQQMAYWREQLANAPAVLELPADRPRPVVQSFRGTTHSLAMSAELTESLKRLSRGEGVTLFMTLLAAFQTLLSRYTGQRGISVGTPIANRNRRETEPLIGFFVNTLVLHTEVRGAESFRQLLQRVREQTLGAYAHQDVPFEKLVEELQPERNLSTTPLFQVMFVYQNAETGGGDGALELPGLQLRGLETESRTAKFELTLAMSEGKQGLGADFEYNTDLFNAETIERLAQHFERLLESIVADPEQSIAELEWLSAAEQQRLLVEWNETHADYPLDQTIHRLFEEQVARTPEQTALVCGESSLTYAELNQRANQLAHYLRELAVGPEVRVGVLMERSVEMVVSPLGVLKAGAAYVPLDASYPVARLEFMIADSGIRALLTQAKLKELVTTPAAVRQVCVDEDWAEIGTRETNNLTLPERSAEHVAYVIYTSGSTGTPKGVMMSHRALCNHMQWMQQQFPLTAADRVVQRTPFSFDASIWEFYAPLLNGATLVMHQAEKHTDPVHLIQTIRQHGVTMLQLVPSLLRVLLEEPELKSCDTLQRVFCGGEVLPEELQREFYARLATATLHNLYGPTEACIDATFRVCGREHTRENATIGRPISNTQTYILDETLKPVAVGVPGQLYIAGAGLARGYLGRPELTAERFIPNPYATTAGARLYVTGDKARYLGGGEIEYLGRVDQQVKLRGFRIELGEIEARLNEQAGVRDAVVMVREDGGQQQLVAYVVSAGETAPSSRELRSYLSERLPEYMVPAATVLLDELPLTANGKVNRRALPAPDATFLQSSSVFTAARTPVEEVLVGIWAEVLKLAQVSVHDNFFDLGGHSLLATRLMSRVRHAFQIEIPLRSLFESPTVAEFAERVESAVRRGQGLEAPPMVAVDRSGELPLSFAQQRLWFLDQLEPGNAFYNIPTGVRLSGQLQVSALEAALTEVVRRHEALRTVFMAEEGTPVQIINPAMPISLPLVDLSEQPESEREAEMLRLAAREAGQPFNLSEGPLLRVRLLKLAEREHVVLLTMHHIVGDGWSMGILMREVSVLYEAYASQQPFALPELRIQYADFAHWQQQWLRDEILEKHLAYWREQLAGAPPVLELPVDRPRPSVQTFRGATHSLVFNTELSEGLKRLSRTEGVTLFMTLLAAFQTLLSSYTGQRDVVVGSPIANRNHGETEGLIGFFANTLVLRTVLADQPSMRTLLKRVREMCLEAYAHQDLPFEKLVEELHPERSLSTTPLFQVMFVFQNAEAQGNDVADAGDLRMSGLESENHTAKFELTLAMAEDKQGIGATFEYNTDLFNAETIERLAQHFERLLESIVADAEQSVAELEFLSEAEREQLLIEWNDTHVDYPAHETIPQLFEAQVARTPEQTALVCGDSSLTYAELNQRANQLAHYLRELGVGPEVRVGVLLERSVEMVVSLLGILKAGGAYVPLDPQYPQSRLAFMLEDARAQLVLSQQSLCELASAFAHSRLVYLDAEQAVIGSYPVRNPAVVSDSQNLAYLIYTSGSTGTPKGVAIEHHSTTTLIHWAQQTFTTSALGGVLASTSLCFDLSIFELFVPLSSGGQVIVADNALALTELAARDQVTLINTVPSAMAELVRLEALPQSVAVVNLAGEALSRLLVESVYEELPHCAVYNLYGPSEDTTYSTALRVPQGETKAPLIGRPLANTQGYVLDQAMQLVPAGVAGELYLSGAGLARGYLGRADLSAERFVPNPWSTVRGERMYRTGDLVRWTASGELEYLGRLDQQVKVRGYRIELGEIEARLLEQEAVAAAVVVVREDDGDKRLVAYVVAAGDAVLNTAELRTHLSSKLPEYMVPAAFVMLDELPLTANGKVNRRALPAPDATLMQYSNVFTPARTPVEELLVGIWAEILKLGQVSIHDNFFDLGGHSLLATRLISRVRHAFQVEIPLRTLFESPTVAQFAARVSAAVMAEQGSAAPPMVVVDRSGELPLSFAQQRLWFLDQLSPENAAYNIPTGVRLEGELDHAALAAALSEVVRRHEALRTVFAMEDGRPVQVIQKATPMMLPVLDLSDLPMEEHESAVKRLVGEEAQQPFNLSQGPLLRVKLLRFGPQEHVVLLTMHHIVSDGWSMGILIEEVSVLYQAYSQQQPSPLPELTIQYADFAHWQQHWLQGEVLEQQMAYWREHLAKAPAVLELPTDRPRPAVQSIAGDMHAVQLGPELTTALKALSRVEGVTLFMTLLAAFQTLLMRYTGQRNIVVGSPIANRNRQEIEQLIGFFVNTLVMHTKLRPEESFRELLGRVREVCFGAYAHQDVPFERLVEELQPERLLSTTPLFQVMFVFQNAAANGEGVELEGLRMKGLETEQRTAKFELLLGMSEDDDGLAATFQYRTELFDPQTIERMGEHFSRLLESIVADPHQSIAELEMISEAEQQRLLVEWNDTQAEYGVDQPIHRLFEEQVARTPEQTALVIEEQEVSYEQLNERANQLAHHLRELGVGPEVTVAVMLDRSVELMISLLAVLKAGGAYLPLDPAYPVERLRFMLQDSGASILLTQQQHAELVSAQQVLCVDTVIIPQSAANLVDTPEAEHAAYVIYTSGSTGEPKGVVVPHRAISNHLLWRQKTYPLSVQDRFLQKASVSFDISVWEIFGTLVSGARLIMARPGGHQDPAYLVDLMASQEVTVAHFGPALLQAIVDEPAFTNCKALRHVFTGGEELSSTLQEQFFSRSSADLHHQYGPTETTVDVTVWDCVRSGEVQKIPIGTPVGNTRVYVLDSNGGLVPTGVPGELHVGGESLARGYLRRPELTTQKFVPDAFSGEAGARLYRTGDLVKWNSQGELEYLGRVDQQVKLRGYRIELGEIEARLLEHEAVTAAVVLMREDNGDKRLVGYVVSAESASLQAAELRHYLSERLPEYMVPAAFVMLEQMPLTTNGKLNRNALPAPETLRQEFELGHVAPRDLVELKLAQIWEEVLNLRPVGVRDNFFELGGHSLLAVQLMARIEKVLNRKLPLSALFQGPTVEYLAGLVRKDAGDISAESSLVPIQPYGTKQPFFCVHAVGGNVMSYVDLARRLGTDQPFYGLQSRGLSGLHAPQTRIEDMASHYIDEIRSVQAEGPYLLGGWSMGGTVAFEMSRQLRAQGEEVTLLALIDSMVHDNSTVYEDDDLALLTRFATDMGVPLSQLELSVNELLQLAPDQQLGLVLAQAKAAGLAPAEIGFSEIENLFNVFKANLNAVRSYELQPGPTPITLFKACDTEGDDGATGWQRFTSAGLDLHTVPGNHYTILREPNAGVLAEHLQTCLEQVQLETSQL